MNNTETNIMNTPQELTYQDLNNELYNTLLDTWFFEPWKNNKDHWKHIELMITGDCNLACEYCYINKNGAQLFPPHTRNITTICENITKILTWLGENQYGPNIDIFSGELFATEDGFKVLDTILNFYRKNYMKYKTPHIIVIPTNGAFLDSYKDEYRVSDYIHFFEEINISLKLSFSIDGFYADPISRPHKTGIMRTQQWYDRCFRYMKHHKFFPHPMIAPSTIHLWKQNFLWWAEMFEKYEMPIDDLFLLEVRNANWTQQNLHDYKEFCEFTMDWLLNYYKGDKKLFLQRFFPNEREHWTGGLNFLGGPFSGDGEQTKCTFQNYLFVRCGDLKLFPCHRNAYSHFELGQLHITDDGKMTLESKNIGLANAIYSFAPTKLPLCHKCAINSLCGTQCYGSCYETTGDLFNPIPTVCALNMIRVKVIAQKMQEYDILYEFLGQLNQTQAAQILQLLGGPDND